MSNRTIYLIAATVGGTVGGLLPGLWGASDFSGWGILLSTVGAIAAVIASYKFIVA
jgi:hypothetical protein